jgi:hypothetical protein
VMLFDHADPTTLHWVLYDGAVPELAASARSAYEKLASSPSSRPRADDYQIDRAWAMLALQAMIEHGN